MSTEIDPRHRVIITEAKFRLVNGVPVPIGPETIIEEIDLGEQTDPEVDEADEEYEVVE